ncbi:Uma2 family endonuclease [Dactylococcopsis salina]|uniref:Putative restriction endonuclease domain-containing protein n=2 Tax=Dactylococcopsis salina TaxID=292566 RepID=K9YV97_DACS8|nr:hypothetical protein Dacsa_1572 [Dactylococcopsis salina PCC 8305]
MMNAITINLQSVELTEEQFFQLCANNRDLRLERNAQGELIIMPPTGGETGNRNARLTQQLMNWTDQDGTGIAFDSSTGFKLPNGANRSPDGAWIPLSRWQELTQKQKEKFIPLCPNFVIELRSPTDKLIDVQNKMQEYLDNGTELGWLINPQDQQVEIYRQNQGIEVLDQPDFLSGEEVLPNFQLDLRAIW